MHISDRISGSFLAVLGTLAYYGGAQLPPVPGQQIGPNVFPMVVGAGIAACGIAIALGVGRSFEEAEEIIAPEPGHEAFYAQPKWLMAFRILIPPMLMLFYAFTVDRLGFVPTGFIMAMVTGFALGGSWKQNLCVALIGPPLIHLIFYKLLRVPLPAGLLPMPW